MFSLENTDQEGVGIGLPLCKQICEGLNGTISLKVRQGVIVKCLIPVKIARLNRIESSQSLLDSREL